MTVTIAPAQEAQAARQTVPAEAEAPISTAALITAMLNASKNVSDLIFSPGRAPQVEMGGQLTQLKIPGMGMLSPEDTARIAGDLLGGNTQALERLKVEGSCDLSYSLPHVARFR